MRENFVFLRTDLKIAYIVYYWQKLIFPQLIQNIFAMN